MKRTNCSACGYDDLRLILDLGLSPIADNYTKDDISVPHYPLQLAVCAGCHLVQLLEVVPDLFGSGYSFYSSASAPLSEYHATYASKVLHEWNMCEEGLKLKPFMVEIGSNDGDFSRHLVEAGWRVLGVDPAIGPASVAEGRGVKTIGAPFGRNIAHEIHAQHGPANIVVANHVLAHVESVSDVLAGVNELLTYNGTAYVEVQYLPDLILNNAIDLVYHEHRNFFSLTSLAAAAAIHGLHVVDARLTSRQGGSLRVKLRRRRETSEVVTGILNSESWLANTDVYAGLQGRAERLKQRLLGLILTECRDDRLVVGYGAPAKGTTLLNFCGIDRSSVYSVIDTTEAKQGRFIPGTGIPIISADDIVPVDTYLMLAWNYTGSIMRKEKLFTVNGGRWIVPIPAPILI